MLLRGVREVAARVNPAEPTAATQRAFDAERERGSVHAYLPAARQITEKLRLPWREVLAVAHSSESRQAQLLGTKTRAPSATDWLSWEHVVTALQLVAARLGVDSLTTAEYRVERAQLLALDRSRWFHGRWLLLPDDEQAITVAGSWDEALRLAGLKTTAERRRAHRGGSGARGPHGTLPRLLRRAAITAQLASVRARQRHLVPDANATVRPRSRGMDRVPPRARPPRAARRQARRGPRSTRHPTTPWTWAPPARASAA